MTNTDPRPNARLQARNNAVARLINAHQTQFNTFMGQEYESRGLGEYTPPKTEEQREAERKARREAKAIEKANKALAEAGLPKYSNVGGLAEFADAG